MGEGARPGRQAANAVRRVLCRVRSRSFLVAGLPRCGTTLLCTGLTRRKWTVYRDPGFVRDLEPGFEGRRGVVHKTHDPQPPPTLGERLRVAFVFGDPYDAVVSIHANLGFEAAYAHAHSDAFEDHDEIFARDLMRLEEHFDRWYRPQGFPFVSVRYDALHEPETVRVLERHFGIRLNLPPWRKRESRWRTHPRREEMEATYGRLAERVAEAAPAKAWPADPGVRPPAPPP